MAGNAARPGFQVLTRDNLADLDEPEDSYWGTGRVFVKPERDLAPLRVGYEFVAARLANSVGISVPAGEVGTDVDGRIAWVSALVGLGEEDIAPEDPVNVVARDGGLAAAVFVFDVWILNSDRWEENLVAHPKLGLWIVDHDQAFGMCHATPGSDSFTECLTRPLTFHVFRDLPLDPSEIDEWCRRIQSLPRSVIEKILREGRDRGLFGRDVERSLSELLLRRQADLVTLAVRSFPGPAGERREMGNA